MARTGEAVTHLLGPFECSIFVVIVAAAKDPPGYSKRRPRHCHDGPQR
jgi:hypothetical protein